MKQKHLTPKKIKNLKEKALKDKPQWKPSKGYKYLKDLELGTMFSTGSVDGVLLECEINARVVILTGGDNISPGKTIIAAKTEVIEI